MSILTGKQVADFLTKKAEYFSSNGINFSAIIALIPQEEFERLFKYVSSKYDFIKDAEYIDEPCSMYGITLIAANINEITFVKKIHDSNIFDKNEFVDLMRKHGMWEL